MSRYKIFNVSRMGYSHIKSGKPCQDYSLSYENEDGTVQVVICCDGHGGDTYVRSDRGSKLAANIALDCIKRFIEDAPDTLFIGHRGAVTAGPVDDAAERLAAKPSNQLNESQREELAQYADFAQQVSGIERQEAAMRRLFTSIYVGWLEAIENDAHENPFTDSEKLYLKNARLVKAYGSTLMAFVRTPGYWFAFHIGDGKMLTLDASMQWSEPVPWDCHCFLNVTTSLCQSTVLPSFRYAFSGEGDFPLVVIMGSDGLDDSWGTFENLANFYSQTLCIFNSEGMETGVKELGEYLPKLSQRASHDDMTMAGIIDTCYIEVLCEYYQTQRKMRALEKEHEEGLKKRQEELAKQQEELVKHKEDLAKQQEELAKRQEELAKQQEELVKRQEELTKQQEELGRQDEQQVKIEDSSNQEEVVNQEQQAEQNEQTLTGKDSAEVAEDEENVETLNPEIEYKQQMSELRATLNKLQNDTALMVSKDRDEWLVLVGDKL